MNLGKRFFGLIWLWAALVPAGSGEVLLRWTTNQVPPAKTLGVTALVIPWNEDGRKLLPLARKQGYRVYVEAGNDSLASAAEAVSKESVAGIILKVEPAERASAEKTLEKVRERYPKLPILMMDTRGDRKSVV